MCLEVIMKKKNLFNLVCVVVTSVLSVSCSQNFYQVYTMDSNDLKMQDNSLLFENADCQVSYLSEVCEESRFPIQSSIIGQIRLDQFTDYYE